jgi:hypothetical protein
MNKRFIAFRDFFRRWELPLTSFSGGGSRPPRQQSNDHSPPKLAWERNYDRRPCGLLPSAGLRP